jgi:hypothetical protein
MRAAPTVSTLLGSALDQRRPFRQTGKLVREAGQVSPGTMPDGSLRM